MSKHIWLVCLVACSSKGSPTTAPALSGNQIFEASTSAMTIFAGTMQSGWQKDSGWSWGAPTPSSTIVSGTLAVNQAGGTGYALTHTDSSGQALNVTLSSYTALSFDLSLVPANLHVYFQQGSGYNATATSPSQLVSTFVAGTVSGMTHVRIPLASLSASLTGVFEIVFENDGAATTYSLNNLILEVAAPATNPAQPTPPAGSLSVYSEGVAAGWSDWSWGGTSSASRAPAMGTTANKFAPSSATFGLKLENIGAAIDPTTYAYANFYIYNPGATALTGLTLAFENNSPDIGLPSIPAQLWTQVHLPLASNTNAYQMLEIRGTSAAAFYVDAIWLEPAVVVAPPPPPVSTVTFNGLHAVGNKLVDIRTGKAVQIHGVNHSSSEYACAQGWGIFEGATDQGSINAMKSWNINAVRVPLNEDCWLGINGVSATYGGSSYRNAITSYVNLLTSNGLYAIVDLHWSAPGTTLATSQVPMADADHSPTFWASVASNFKSNGSVIFELFNEPYVGNNGNSTADWKCWRDGGSACSESFAIAGMQSLLYAVRGTGATNLVLLGGINYSNALGQWAAYKPSDTKSSSDSTAINNLAVAWHVYAGNWCESNVSPYTCNAAAYSAQAGTLAQSYPIVATETGDNDTPCSSANSTFVTDFMTWMDQHGQGYTAWNYGAWGGDCSDYSLVTNEETGAATSYGAPIKTHLLGR